MAEIAIIVATYNGEKFIGEQLDSILRNSFTDFEIYVCDDGSSDDTKQVVAEYMTAHPNRIHWHKNEQNLGVIRNFLCAVEQIEADYFMFCDQDDVWLPDKLAHTLSCMKKAEEELPERPITVFGDATMVDGDLKPLGSSFQKVSNLNPTDVSLSHLVMENAAIGCTVMINCSVKQLLQEIPELPKEVRMHDCWVAMISAALGKLVFLDEELLLYRQHGNNTLGGMSDLAYARKNMGRLARIKAGLHDSCRQAGALLTVYGKYMTTEQQEVLRKFAEIPEQSWLTRRITLVKGHYYKTGFLKNLCVFLII